MTDLDGIRVDIDKIIEVFGRNKLNYTIYPNYYDQNGNNHKAYWTENELVQFLKEKAEKLSNNLEMNELDSLNRYDALLVIISCHGMERYVLTSDHKKVSKIAIHRIFSGQYPLSRKIPRCFVFDCCSGSGQREADWRGKGHKDNSEEESESDQGKNILDAGKQTEIGHIASGDNEDWMYGEDNPDYKLVTIMAANDGYQSKMSTEKGSYVITSLMDGISNNIDEHDNDKFLNTILDEIQEKLHDDGKQLMVKTFNNKTEFIKFEARDYQNVGDQDQNIGDGHVEGIELVNKKAAQESKPQDEDEVMDKLWDDAIDIVDELEIEDGNTGSFL